MSACVVVTGPIGVGKTTTVQAIGDLLAARGIAHTLVDMDWLRSSWPVPPGDRFNVELGYRNLVAVARTGRAAGSEVIVVADMVETRAQRERYREAIPGAEVTVVRLLAPPDVIGGRIRQRAGDAVDPWELERAAELTAIMGRNRVADVTIDTTGRTPREVAEGVMVALGW